MGAWESKWQEVPGRQVGQGGQGVIQLVACMASGQLGALKTLHRDGANASERRMRMRKEAIGLRKARGLGIPRVLDTNTETAEAADELYIVMELIDGRTLDRVVNGKPLSIDAALEYARQLTRIVLRCHAEGVLHRDIKPSNIVVDNNETLHLVDFGIAWLPEDDRPGHNDHTDTGQELGNRFLRLYELAGGHERADHRSDLTFVVGVLYYMLTAKNPLKLAHGADAAPPHVFNRDAFPRQTLADSRYRQIERIFDVGFQIAPNDRFATAAKLLVRLEDAADNAPPPTDHVAVFEAFDDFVKGSAIRTRHGRLLGLRQAALAFQHKLYALGEARHVKVMMLTQPEKRGESWVSPIRFEHLTLGFVMEASHALGLENNDVVCSTSLAGDKNVYYRDVAADLKGLNDAVLHEAERLLAAVLGRHMRSQNLLDDVFD